MKEIKHNLKMQKENIRLKSGDSCNFTFYLDTPETSAKHRLFFSCEDASWYGLKNESGAELLYMLIDDSLNSEEAEQNNYCLDFSTEKPLLFAKRALRKISWQPLMYGLFSSKWVEDVYSDEWQFGVYAKAKNLQIEDGGYIRVRVDKWLVREGVNPNDTIAPPDETHFIDISEGTYGYTMFSDSISVGKQDTACVIFTVEGEGYSGNVYFERPFFTDSFGNNLLPDFDRCSIGIEHTAWLGQNLMKREWPRFKIEVNGKECFDGESFLKIHRFTPIEIELEDNLFRNGENSISITYFGDYINPVPVLIDEVYLLETEKKPFTVVRCPDSAVFGEKLSVLLESDREIEFESSDFELVEIAKFDELAFRVLVIKPIKNKNGLKFTVKCEDFSEEFSVDRCIHKIDDGIIAGSGDMIYVDISDEKQVRDYVKWYVQNNVGKMLTIRQVYRWGGQRYVNPKVWESFTALCEKLGIYYVLISDGRDIPSIATNPTKNMLKGEKFLGRQLHERDGQLFYWGAHPREICAPLEEFHDLAARLGRECPDTVEGAFRPFNIEYSEAGYSFKREHTKIPDMRVASEIVASELKNLSSDNYGRHTGPAVTFKYFYENGFDFCGAETMDSATETLLAFLRGASSAYGKKTSGVHLALQWSTFPHDTEERYRRYMLSLYIPYMHGVTDINTEEGLWFMEAYYTYHNRLSAPCERNRKIKSDFNDFINTHSRTGKFYTPIAFIHGNLDGWNGFGGLYSWGMPSMPFSEADESWKLMKVFYPQNTVRGNGCSDTGAIFEGKGKPCGVFSGTPMGNVDAVPAEHGDLSKYSLLIFAGYNCMTEDILARVASYVKGGGKLIASWSHFTDTTLYEDIVDYNLNIIDSEITRKLSADNVRFVTDTVDGEKVTVCKNTPADASVIKFTDSGVPFVFSASYGKGEIFFVNTLYYPGNETVLPIYENLVKEESAKVLSSEPIKVSCDVDVQYTVYTQDNGTRHYYFTALDWYKEPDRLRTAEITFDGNSYPVNFVFGELVKVVTDGKRAVWPKDYTSEVIEITDTYFKAQGVGVQKFLVATNGSIKEYELDFTNESTLTVKF